MTFIFGGAYQGMEEYARDTLGAQEICMLDEKTRVLDFSKKAFSGLERFVLGCVRRGENAQDYFAQHMDSLSDAILIGMDLSCGVVPLDAEMRLWRDENGRVNNLLAANARHVVRMFCGIAQVVK